MEFPPGWDVRMGDPGGKARGRTYFAEKRVVISPSLHPWQMRATLMHERVHVERGPLLLWGDDPEFASLTDSFIAIEERTVNREAARRLIPLDALREALPIGHIPTMADRLKMPTKVVLARIYGLSVEELESLPNAMIWNTKRRRLRDVVATIWSSEIGEEMPVRAADTERGWTP